MTAPLLKCDPKYGYFPWWPEDGDAWVHPDDVAAARAMIPRGRVSPKREMRVSEKLAHVFRREGGDGHFLLLHYGDVRLRVRRSLWQEVEPEGLEIGDWVEVQTRGMVNEPRIGVIREMLWDERGRAMRYQISENGQPIERLFAREDLQRVEPPKLPEIE